MPLRARILLGSVVFPLPSPTVLISTYLQLIFKQMPLGINNAAFLRQPSAIFPIFHSGCFLFGKALGEIPKRGQRPLAPQCTEPPLQELPRAVCPFWKVRFGLCSEGGREMLQIPVLKTVCPLAGFDMCVSTERLVGNTSLCIPTKVKR